MVRVRREEPFADRARHRVQVVAVVSRRGRDDMIAAGDEDEVVVVSAERDVQVA